MKNHPLKPITIMFLIGALLILFVPMAIDQSAHSDTPLPEKEKIIRDTASYGLSEATLSTLLRNIKQREYHISFDSARGRYQSPNRKHGIRTYYQSGIWQMQSRFDSLRWAFTLTTEGLYADGVCFANNTDDAKVRVSADTINFEQAEYTEQYINDAKGVRQNFIFNQAPKNSKELSVRLDLSGIEAYDDTEGVIKLTNGRKTLFYSGLKAWDATGQLLASTMGLSPDRASIILKVLSEGACFPITIDPIVASGDPGNADFFVESNQANAQMGVSVSSAGDVNGDGYSDVIVGVPLYDNGEAAEGAAFVYHGNAAGLSSTTSVILESNQTNARLGISVSFAGDVNGDGYSDVLVGANQYSNGESTEGAAYVYHGSIIGLSSTANVILESNQSQAQMGYSVSSAGDVNGDSYSDVIVGVINYDNGESNEGATFVYHGSATGLNSTVNTILESNQVSAQMGFSVSSAGDINGDGYSDVIVGAPSYDDGETNEGAAFIYHGSSIGLSATANSVLESNQVNAQMGYSVSSTGDVNGDGYSDIVVGAPFYDNGESNEGAAFVYHGSAMGLSISASVILDSNQANAQLGHSVSSAGDVNGDGIDDLIIGATRDEANTTNAGAGDSYV
ncbi:MAG: integrin alpha, partial [Bacteroidota bacterium]